jgi:predicted amidohydrolase YtcJ
LWVLNSRGLELAGIASDTGRLFRADVELRRLPHDVPDLAPVGRLLSQAGVTGVTDATVDLGDEGAAILADAVTSGVLPLQVNVLGAVVPESSPLSTGPHKIVLDEARGIDPGAVAAEIATAHDRGRAVAIHCVTVTEVLLAIDCIDAAGPLEGDRLEHASELPRHADAAVLRLGLTVVTQPGFIWARGDTYIREVAPEDHDILYRCGTLLDAGIPVGGSSDAPFGPADPWLAMRVAVERRTGSGTPLGLGERISSRRALDLFLSPLEASGAPARTIAVGARADLCLLDVPFDRALADLDATHVRLTMLGGQIMPR